MSNILGNVSEHAFSATFSITFFVSCLNVVVNPLSIFLPGTRGLDKEQLGLDGRHMSMVLEPAVIP